MNDLVSNLKTMGFEPIGRTSHSLIMKSPNGVAAVYNDGNYEGFVKHRLTPTETIDESKLRHFLEMLLVVSLTTTYFTTDITIVSGESMEPAYHSGEIIIKSKSSKDVKNMLISKDAVVKFKSPDNETMIKRVVGVSGDEIEYRGASLFVNGKFIGENLVWAKQRQDKAFASKDDAKKIIYKPFSFTLKSGEYYVVGDNKDFSIDSRNFGPISSDCIISVVSK